MWDTSKHAEATVVDWFAIEDIYPLAHTHRCIVYMRLHDCLIVFRVCSVLDAHGMTMGW